MVLTVLLVLFLGLCVSAATVWGMLTHACPECSTATQKETVIPVVPFFLWLCPGCTKLRRTRDVRTERI